MSQKIVLYPYQNLLKNNSARLVAEGKRRIIVQLPTGGGKTVVAASIVTSFLEKSNKSTLTIAHRREIINQLNNTYQRFELGTSIVGTKTRPAKVYLSMVETLNNLLKRYPQMFSDVGLVIMDEAHIANHIKILEFFPQAIILGFTATPISSSKKRPLKNHFQDIATGADIPQLIEAGALCTNVTIQADHGGIDRSKFATRGGEFTEKSMSAVFSLAPQVGNTYKAYMELIFGLKTIIFNVDIAHSLKVVDYFRERGLNVRHLDGKTSAGERAEILFWFKNNPDAILCNVGVLTAGFDEPSIGAVVINKSTQSVTQWLQMCGRGSRIHPGKEKFYIIDMGKNAISLGDWHVQRDWHSIFHYPDAPTNGVAPQKECPECMCLNHLSARFCRDPDCGYEFPKREKVELPVEFQTLTSGISIEEIKRQTEERRQKEYAAFYKIAKLTIRKLKGKASEEMIFALVEEKAREWCASFNPKKPYTQWHVNEIKNLIKNENQLLPQSQPLR